MPAGLSQSGYTFDAELKIRTKGTPVSDEDGDAITSGFEKGRTLKCIMLFDTLKYSAGNETYSIRIEGRDSADDSWETLGIEEISGTGSPYTIAETNYEFFFNAAKSQIRYTINSTGTAPSCDPDIYLHSGGKG
jgi:hypothetical protein